MKTADLCPRNLTAFFRGYRRAAAGRLTTMPSRYTCSRPISGILTVPAPRFIVIDSAACDYPAPSLRALLCTSLSIRPQNGKSPMSSPCRTPKSCAASRPAGQCKFRLVVVWLFALTGCSSEQLQSFSEVMRAVNDEIRSTNPVVTTIPQPVSQPGCSQWCIHVARIPPVGTVFQARLQNTCNETVHVTYGYRAVLPGTPHQFPWCAPGQAGLRSGTVTLAPWQSQSLGPLVQGHLDQVFWCACSAAHARAVFAEPAGPGINNCACRCAPR